MHVGPRRCTHPYTRGHVDCDHAPSRGGSRARRPPGQVGGLYERRGQARPVSAATGLWALLLGWFFVGLIVWFVKTNTALNDYWRSPRAS